MSCAFPKSLAELDYTAACSCEMTLDLRASRPPPANALRERRRGVVARAWPWCERLSLQHFVVAGLDAGDSRSGVTIGTISLRCLRVSSVGRHRGLTGFSSMSLP